MISGKVARVASVLKETTRDAHGIYYAVRVVTDNPRRDPRTDEHLAWETRVGFRHDARHAAGGQAFVAAAKLQDDIAEEIWRETAAQEIPWLVGDLRWMERRP